MRKNYYFFILLLAALFLAACGSDEQVSGENKNNSREEQEKKADDESEKAEEEVKISSTVPEILEENPGQYAGTKYNTAIVHKELNEDNFLEKDSFQIYGTLLGLIAEGENYKPHYDYFKDFNPSIETVISQAPGGMQIDANGEVGVNANISILLDASGSMAQKIGGKTKMELATDAINEFVSTMPEDANVSLRVYGHKGSNSDSDKKISCESTEMIYDLKPYNASDFEKALDAAQPTGWTPIAKANNEAKADFEKANKPGKNIIYVVSDGVETCDGDPVKAAKELHDSNIEAVVNIIGFDVDNSGQKQLIDIANAGGGQFETVQSADDFKKLWEDERRRLWNEWWNWSNKNWNEIWTEQNKKTNELWDAKSKFNTLHNDERSRLKEASSYLQSQEQISWETRTEVDSLIDQRYDILKEHFDPVYEELKETVVNEGETMKEAVKAKGEEMKEKYKF